MSTGASQNQFLEQRLLSMQEYGTTDDNVYLQTLQQNGIASGTEGKLQVAVLVFSILAVLFNLVGIWGFIFLRILGLFYVQKQVCQQNYHPESAST